MQPLELLESRWATWYVRVLPQSVEDEEVKQQRVRKEKIPTRVFGEQELADFMHYLFLRAQARVISFFLLLSEPLKGVRTCGLLVQTLVFLIC